MNLILNSQVYKNNKINLSVPNDLSIIIDDKKEEQNTLCKPKNVSIKKKKAGMWLQKEGNKIKCKNYFTINIEFFNRK